MKYHIASSYLKKTSVCVFESSFYGQKIHLDCFENEGLLPRIIPSLRAKLSGILSLATTSNRSSARGGNETQSFVVFWSFFILHSWFGGPARVSLCDVLPRSVA